MRLSPLQLRYPSRSEIALRFYIALEQTWTRLATFPLRDAGADCFGMPDACRVSFVLYTHAKLISGKPDQCGNYSRQWSPPSNPAQRQVKTMACFRGHDA